jgi:hypothetical protein
MKHIPPKEKADTYSFIANPVTEIINNFKSIAAANPKQKPHHSCEMLSKLLLSKDGTQSVESRTGERLRLKLVSSRVLNLSKSSGRGHPAAAF